MRLLNQHAGRLRRKEATFDKKNAGRRIATARADQEKDCS
jgi:hypothetical protein